MKLAKSFKWSRKRDIGFENVLVTVFQVDSFSSVDGSLVSSVSPFSSSDLGFINQSGGTNY